MLACMGSPPHSGSSHGHPWSPEVTSVDASLHGFGVTACQFEADSVGKIGRVSERCRFRGELRKCIKPRDDLDELDVPFSFLARGSDREFLETGALTEFAEVPERFAKDAPWCVIAARRWRRKEKILNLEAEAALWAARRISRDRHLGDHRHLILSDSMAWVCAATKGRGSPWFLLRRCRELCALAIASGCRFVYRWIPSEWNSSDAPSRRYDPTSEHHARHFHDRNPSGSACAQDGGSPDLGLGVPEPVVGDGVPHPPGLRRLAAAVPFAYGLPGHWEAARCGPGGHDPNAGADGRESSAGGHSPRGGPMSNPWAGRMSNPWAGPMSNPWAGPMSNPWAGQPRQPARGSPPPEGRVGGQRRAAPGGLGRQGTTPGGATGAAPVALDPDRERGPCLHAPGGARLPCDGAGGGVSDAGHAGQLPGAPGATADLADAAAGAGARQGRVGRAADELHRVPVRLGVDRERRRNDAGGSQVGGACHSPPAAPRPPPWPQRPWRGGGGPSRDVHGRRCRGKWP